MKIFENSSTNMGDSSIRVLHSIPASTSGSGYLDQLIDGAPDELDVIPFSWKAAILKNYDVFHIHWPEFLFRGASHAQKARKLIAFLVLVSRLKMCSTYVVRTLHNVEPHEVRGKFDRFLLQVVDRNTDAWIRLNETTPVPQKGVTATIPHGHYRHLRRSVVSPPQPGRLLYFGHIRPYKNVDVLAAAFREISDPGLSLHILGKPLDSQVEDVVRDAVGSDDRVRCSFAFASDEELIDEIEACSLVVLPYREMHNSGAVLLALSLDRPCLVPDTPVNRMLRDEVGDEWLWLYDNEFTSDKLRAAIRGIGSIGRGSVPMLDRRNLNRIGDEHFRLYANGCARKGRVVS